jgi:predicted DNA repair protein MutK
MAFGLLLLLDDIATLLDDVAVMTKMAAKKTAGVLGDDLALNAQQVTGVQTDRELPVVWAVAKGSMVNKAILVPVALVISWLAPWVITPLLMLGGLFLCFEGFEKLAHKFLHSAADDQAVHQKALAALADGRTDLVAFEREKIKGAVRTDFILSAEIVVITLGTVAAAGLAERVAVLVGISVLMTVGVYGLVAAIVKLDDVGVCLNRSANGLVRRVGGGLLVFAPWLMKALSVVGTAAMFMVGGGILVHGWPWLHQAMAAFEQWLAPMPGGAFWAAGLGALGGGVLGVAAGAVALGLWNGVQRIRSRL